MNKSRLSLKWELTLYRVFPSLRLNSLFSGNLEVDNQTLPHFAWIQVHKLAFLDQILPLIFTGLYYSLIFSTKYLATKKLVSYRAHCLHYASYFHAS